MINYIIVSRTGINCDSFKPNAAMKMGIATFLFIALSVSCSYAQEAEFQFVLSGIVAEKLEPGTKAVFNSYQKNKETYSFLLEDLPFTIPAEYLLDRSCDVSFRGPDGAYLFSLELSKQLFDKPRKINLKLVAPDPHISPILGYRNDFKYYAKITRRMCYTDLPMWDSEQKKLVKSRPPRMIVENRTDGRIISDGETEHGCFDSRRYAVIREKLADGTSLHFTAIYDSGGLFDEIRTTFDFTYHKHLHFWQ